MSGEKNPSTSSKRLDYIDWEDYFMGVAFLAAKRSKDPKRQVGACIVNEDKRIVGVGYNGFPRGCNDDEFPWGKKDSSPLNNKYFYVCHAEVNAILNKNSSDVKGCKLYVALFPCNECAKVIIQSGISEVIYMSDKNHDKLEVKASRRMLEAANVKYRSNLVRKVKLRREGSNRMVLVSRFIGPFEVLFSATAEFFFPANFNQSRRK